jgi:hypothetical protein
MTDIDNDWCHAMWGLGVVGLDEHDQISRAVIRVQPADATWERQHDLAREITADHGITGWTEIVWVTPDGRLFFVEPHREKDQHAVGRELEQRLTAIRFDQSALIDEEVERRRVNGRYDRRPVERLPIYWWFLVDPDSGAIALGPDPAAPPDWKETPSAARQRLGLERAPGGYIHAIPADARYPMGSWRLTDEASELWGEETLARLIVERVERREAGLIAMGARPRPTWQGS